MAALTKIEKTRKEVYSILKPLGFEASVKQEKDGIGIEPDTRKTGNKRKDYFDGMKLMCWNDGTFEVAEYQAGKKQNELHIFKETKSLRVAICDLIKGNKRKPVKIFR